MFKRMTTGKSPKGTEVAHSDSEETIGRSNASNPAAKVTTAQLKARIAETEIALAGLKNELKEERAGKRKLYSSLVKLAQELKKTRAESKPLRDAVDYANQPWYQGGMWRAPAILPGVINQNVAAVFKESTGLSSLFFNLCIVTAFSRVGVPIAKFGIVSVDSLLYFAVFWMIWTKDTNYTTRFDATDLSYEVVNVLSCIAVLMGSITIYEGVETEEGARIMMLAGFVATLHLFVHIRLYISYFNGSPGSIEAKAKHHALFSVIMTVFETATWLIGVMFREQLGIPSWAIFTIGIAFSIARLPKNFLETDFHAASTKRGVIFILLLGFVLQSVLVVSSSFFDWQMPDSEQYIFLGSCCILLYTIKLFYMDDAPKQPQDHALLVSRVSALLFNIAHFGLLLSTTVMGAGLSLMTQSYLSARAALEANTKEMVCGGYGAVILTIFLMKSLHLKRVPVSGGPKALFLATFLMQVLVTLAVVGLAGSMYMGKSYFGIIAKDEITLMVGLAGVTFFLVILSWLDEAIELSLYQSGDDSRSALVHPFGFWWCCVSDTEVSSPLDDDSEGSKVSQMTPLLGSSASDLSPTKEGYDAIDRGQEV